MTKNQVIENNLGKKVINKILNDIKADLKTLKVKHKNFISEKNYLSKETVKKLKKKLFDLKIAYYGYQEKPKNIEDDNWEKKRTISLLL